MPDSLGRLAELHDAGVFGFKCFLLDSGVPEFPPLSPAQLTAAMTEIAAFDGLLIVHAEDPGVIGAERRSPARSATPTSSPPGPRPPRPRPSRTVIAAARETGCRTHLVHLSSAEALPAIWPRPARTAYG